jgi:hypothetical protein
MKTYLCPSWSLFAVFAFAAALFSGCASDGIADLEFRAYVCFEATPNEIDGSGLAVPTPHAGAHAPAELPAGDTSGRRFFGPNVVPLTLPNNPNKTYYYLREAALNDVQFLDVRAVDVKFFAEMPAQPMLSVTLNESATQRFYANSMSRRNEGSRRAFLFVNNQAVGTLVLRENIRNGVLLFSVDFAAATSAILRGKALNLQKELQKTVLVLRKATEEKK